MTTTEPSGVQSGAVGARPLHKEGRPPGNSASGGGGVVAMPLLVVLLLVVVVLLLPPPPLLLLLLLLLLAQLASFTLQTRIPFIIHISSEYAY